jgi:hypothetical protein
MSENTEADHVHSHNHARQDDHVHSHEHHHSHSSDLKHQWDTLRKCVTAAGITNRWEITEALTIWQSKSRAQLDTPPPYLLTAMPGHVSTAALRWDWDSHSAQEFARWCMETLRERFGISWRVDCEEEDPQLGPHYLRMTLGEQQEYCDWRYLNRNHWMGAFCTIADRLLGPVGVTALSLETGWFDTVVVFCRSDYAEEMLRWFPEAE